MNVLVIGVGSVGSVIARHLRDSPSIDSLTLADKDVSRARDIAAQKGGAKVEVVTLDADKPGELEKLLRGKGIVVNSGHPRFNDPIMKLCLKLGVNYVDLASSNVAEQLSYDRGYRKANIMGLVFMGEDPGLSNIYARYAADRLDRVDEIRVRDGEFSVSKIRGFVPLFSPEVFFEEVLTDAIIFANGQVKKLPPMSEREEYDFLPPIGKQVVYALEHEEVQTLPYFIKKGVRYVDFKLALSDEFVANVKLLRELGLLSHKPLNVKGLEVKPFDLFIATLPIPVSVASALKGHAGISIEVAGMVQNRKTRFVLATQMSHKEAYKRMGANATSYLTGMVPAVFVSAFCEGKIDRKGVFPAEMLDADMMIRELSKAGVRTTISTVEEASFDQSREAA